MHEYFSTNRHLATHAFAINDGLSKKKEKDDGHKKSSFHKSEELNKVAVI